MKSVIFSAAVLAGAAVAQPHGGHHARLHQKRDLVVEWETEWVTATVVVEGSSTETILPTATTTPEAGGNFFEPPSNVPTQVEQEPTEQVTKQAAPTEQATTQEIPPPPPAPTTFTTSSTSTPPPPPPPAPTTTTTPEPQPAPTSTQEQEPKPSPTGSDDSGDSAGGNLGFTRTGEVTYYDPTAGGQAAIGSCGFQDSGTGATEDIAAIDMTWFQAVSSATSYMLNVPANPLCNKVITITDPETGNSIDVRIRDACPGCGPWGVDITEGAFKKLFGSTTRGTAKVTWSLHGPVPTKDYPPPQ